MQKKVILLSLILKSIIVLNVQAQFSMQGHRGCRGLLPENTIPAFLKAVELGVTTLEMDVVITKDKKVVVSHESWMNHEICHDKNGNEIDKSNEKLFNIFQMAYEEVKQFDCGTKPHQRFPLQKKMKAVKPLLEDVIDSVELFISENKLPRVFYNIELKTEKDGEGIFHPTVEEFCRLVVEVLDKKNMLHHINLQSFDLKILQHLHINFSQIKLALLVENTKSADENLLALGFAPAIYSPYYLFVNKNLVTFCRNKEMKLIPWTVNETKDMQKLIELGVDGIITDYPDRLVNVRHGDKAP